MFKNERLQFLTAGFLILFLVSNFIGIFSVEAATSDTIIITEVMANPSDGSEWIKVYNYGEAIIDLSQYSFLNKNYECTKINLGFLNPREYTFIFNTSTVDSSINNYKCSYAFNNNGGTLSLKNGSSIVSQVVYPKAASGVSWQSGINPPATETNNSENSNSNQIESPADNSTSTPEIEDEEVVSCPLNSLVINELVSDPGDGAVEWIEIYNRSSKSVDLTGWEIQDADENPDNLVPTPTEIEAFGYLMLYKGENFKFILNNDKDLLQLVCGKKIMDSVSYGSFDDGQIDDNAPVASDPLSLARVEDGRDTNSDKDDFAVTATPTPGRANIINVDIKANQTAESGQTFTSKIIINEILPNPAGSDSETEFIELYNQGEQEVDLTGWKLSDSGSRLVTLSGEKFGDLKIGAGKYLVLWRKQTGVALNNSGQDVVKLYWPNDKITSEIEYSGAIADDVSYSRTSDGAWFWSQKATPNSANEIIQANQCPQAVINYSQPVVAEQETIFDGSDSSDPDGETVVFLWTFNDKTTSSADTVKKTFDKSGSQKVTLKVTDENDCSTETKIEFKVEKVGTVAGTITGLSTAGPVLNPGAPNNSSREVYLSEIFPNPKGADAGQEWIEICSRDNLSVSGLQLELETSGPPKVYPLSEINWSGGPCQQIMTSDLKIILPNTAATLRLRDSSGTALDSASYTKSTEGQSYVWAAGTGWSWSAEVTPGALNPGTNSDNSNSVGAAEVLGMSILSLAAIKNLPEGSLVTAHGQVLVLPGILGSQIFYLGDENAGLQIYMYKKDFPALKLGDWLEITGTVTPSGQQKRLKVVNKSDIVVLKSGEVPVASAVDLAELQEDNLDSLISVSGILNSRSGRAWLLSENDQTLEVYFKQSLTIPDNQPGASVKATGILSWAEDHYRLLPRTSEDLEVISSTSETQNATSTGSFLAGEAMSLTLGTGNDWQRAWKALGLSGGGLGLFLLGLYVGRRKAV